MKTRESIWNKSYILLLQGNLVSGIGDVVYVMALGFWVMAQTGSPGMMGTLMAASALPRVFVSPLAGVLVDRYSRKWIIVWMDIIRGIAVLLVALAAFHNMLTLPMVFAAGIVIGTCASFFSPAVNALLPDIVPKSKIIEAGSAHSSVHTIADVVGNFIGGTLLALFGAPLMFLANALTFILSGFSEVFISEPAKDKIDAQRKITVLSDMKQGFNYMWNHRGIRFLFFTIAVINLCSAMGVVLFIPFFHEQGANLHFPFFDHYKELITAVTTLFGNSSDKESLAKISYSVVMTSLTIGMFFGFSLLSFKPIKPSSRFSIMIFLAIPHAVGMIFMPMVSNILIISFIVMFYGFVLGVSNTFIMGSLQINVPRNYLGKVFSLVGMMGGGLAPVGMALGGVLAELLTVRIVISLSFSLLLIPYIFMIFMPRIKEFINSAPRRNES